MKIRIPRVSRTLLIAILGIVLISSGCSNRKPDSAKESGSDGLLPQHPLDPLGVEEIKLVRQLLLKEGKMDTTFRFYVINLKEPPKAEMLKYKAGDAFRREAFAVLYDRPNNKTFEALVDLTAKKVISFTLMKGVTAGGFAEDSVTDEILKKDPLWLAGLQKRGIHPDSVKTSFVFAGDMGMAPADHREMICTPQYINKKYHDLLIDGLVAYVDLTENKVLRVMDDGGKSFYKPEDTGYFEIDSAKLLTPDSKPLRITQPQGKSFVVEGFSVKGSSWSFRLGMDNREGLILHDVSFNDNGVIRPVIYRASVAEMYVPYGSTDLTHSAWNYFDVGAYRMGQAYIHSMSGLKAGDDVPENSSFMSAIFHDERGMPKKIDSVVAIYEEYGGPLTRHGKFSRAGRNLAVKYFTKVWNYDYGFTWVFHEDGTIDLKAELTGVVGIKGVNRTSDLPGGADESYNGTYFGTLVAPHIEATNHQHFFTFRLDMDVNGRENMVEEMNTVAMPAGEKNPWNNAFVRQMSLIRNESEGQRNLNAGTHRHWMVGDATSVNGLGQQKSYVLMPGQNASPYAAMGSGPRKMADFLESQLWVTAYKENESYPAGDYPNTRGVKDGLPSWVNDNESLQGKDVVLWYNLGVTHIVRPEDWPIMSVHTIGFSLMPFGFFEKNPVVGIKRNPSRTAAVIDNRLPPDVTLCVPLPSDKKITSALKRN